MTAEVIELELPADLGRRLRRKFVADGQSLESFVVSVLEELARDSARIERAEEELLAERLRSLGYLSRD